MNFSYHGKIQDGHQNNKSENFNCLRHFTMIDPGTLISDIITLKLLSYFFYTIWEQCLQKQKCDQYHSAVI